MKIYFVICFLSIYISLLGFFNDANTGFSKCYGMEIEEFKADSSKSEGKIKETHSLLEAELTKLKKQLSDAEIPGAFSSVEKKMKAISDIKSKMEMIEDRIITLRDKPKQDTALVEIRNKKSEHIEIKNKGTVILKPVLFEFNSARVEEIFYKELDMIYEKMLLDKMLKLEVQGHTDNIGEESYNKRLSEKRAEAVCSYLVSKGVSRNRLVNKGLGNSKPTSSNNNIDGSDNPKGRANNRRVEFIIIN